MSGHSSTWPYCDCCTEYILEIADRAITNGRLVVRKEHSIAVAPDMMLLEGIANGHQIPDGGWKLDRPDGRSAVLYQRGAAA